MKVLLVDDDRELVDLLSYWFKSHGHEVSCAFDGEQGLKRWQSGDPEVVVLDVNMPKMTGFEVCREMQTRSDAYVLMLTGCDNEEQEIQGLTVGADDYIRKPFSPRHFAARFKAVVRRSRKDAKAAPANILTCGPYTLDTMRNQVTIAGAEKEIRLTPTESRLLFLLMNNAKQVLPTQVIIERVWGYGEAEETSLVKTYIRHLRGKLEPQPSKPVHFLTVPGVGYSFSPVPQSE